MGFAMAGSDPKPDKEGTEKKVSVYQEANNIYCLTEDNGSLAEAAVLFYKEKGSLDALKNLLAIREHTLNIKRTTY